MNYEEIVCDATNLCIGFYKVSVKSSKWKESTQKIYDEFPAVHIRKSKMILINRTLQNGLTQEFELQRKRPDKTHYKHSKSKDPHRPTFSVR